MTDTFSDEISDTRWFPSDAVIAAEMSVLGAAIESREAAETMTELLTSADCFRPAHQHVFEAVEALVVDGRPIDAAAVLEELTRRGTASKAGGAPFLFTLIEHRAFVSAVSYHAATIRTDAVRRRVYAAGLSIQDMGLRKDFDLDTDIDGVRKLLDDACSTVIGDEPLPIGMMLDEVLSELEQPLDNSRLIEPPYLDLQLLLSGLRGGQLITIAARPGAGKSVTGLDWVRHTSIHQGLPSLLVTLEMSYKEVMMRLLSAEASVDLKRLVDRTMEQGDWDRVAKVHERVVNSGLVIDDQPEYTLARLRSRLRAMARKAPARLVVIDYLQLMKAPAADTREQAIASITRALKMMAREFDVPIILLAQLNRGSEHRQDKRPVASDIRESGAVEQDSDIVILIHREEMHDKESPRAGEADLIIDKQRAGARGTVVIGFAGHYARGFNLAKSWS